MLNDLFININEAECGYRHRHNFGYWEGKPEHIDINRQIVFENKLNKIADKGDT